MKLQKTKKYLSSKVNEANKLTKLKTRQGFSLVEMLVAVALFSAVMLIGVGALLSLIDANRKAQSLNSIMNNLNFALESMSRNMRVGTTYHCGITNNVPPNIKDPKNCSGGGKLLGFESSGGDPENPNDQVVYRINGTQLEKSIHGGSPGTFIGITASEVIINDFFFYVDGASNTDNLQPKIVMTIRGSAGTSEKTRTEFNLQTMVSQRVLDL
ncbi:MAG: type II secretion system protein [Candidatus Pacebacteria bacterium]|jgi:prepilin-type N-terminal cleavage/methylation domain-containing protein|nr:type II secretion system protein [Candidatus Paceibacterota bacterium]|tara:strand:+ start:37891 stop:38529 length:639 start_codon:yes stop_codon:yes gene_type:complete